MVKITSFTSHQTSEGDRLSYAFSEIDETGVLKKSNERDTFVIMDETIRQKIRDIEKFILDRKAIIDSKSRV